MSSLTILAVLVACAVLVLVDRRARHAISNRVHGLVLAGSWPLLYLPLGVAGPATAAAACGVLLVCLVGRPTARRYLDSLTLLLFGFLTLLVLRAEITHADGISRELGFFLLACSSALLIGFLCRWTGILVGALWFTWPLIVILGFLPQEFQPNVNEIVVGNIAWIQIAAALTLRNRFLKVLGSLFGLYAFSLTPSLGPVLSALVAALWLGFFHRAAIRSYLPSWSRPFVGLGIAAFGLAGLQQLVGEIRSAAENGAAGASVASRSRAWNQIVSEPSLAGHGLVPIQDSADQYLLNHAHNFILGALYSTGVLGLVLLLWIVVRALKSGTSGASTLDVSVAVGLVAAHLVSGDFYNAPPLWLALGYLASLRGGPFIDVRRGVKAPSARASSVVQSGSFLGLLERRPCQLPRGTQRRYGIG